MAMLPPSSESRTINIYGGQGGNGGRGGVQGGAGGAGEGNNLNWVVNAQNFTSTVYAGKAGENAREAIHREDRARIIVWFSPINFFERQADIFRARQPGTGEWLLLDDLFEQWKSSPGEILWCKGMPGAGKTVLSSIVVNHLETTTSSLGTIAVACMYLNHKEIQIQTPSNLLAGLWRQLVHGKPISAESMVQNLYQRHSEKGTRPHLTEIHEVLSSVVAQWQKIYIVVDALDEYPENDRKILLEYLAAMGPTVNLMLTSRPHITLPSIQDMITLDIRAPDEDIRSYVNQQIQTDCRLSLYVQASPELQEEIITRIVGTVDGMFLLAKLHTESLATKTTLKLVRENLENLPKDLNAAYKDTMDRINQQRTGDRELALAALTWVANAMRVLRVEELQDALAVKPGAKDLDPDDRPEISIILGVCAGLIIVDEVSTVRLVHYSTQAYLDGLFPNAQADITRTLLTYLTFNETRIHMTLHSLFHYCHYCLVHAVGQPEVELRDMILNFLEVAQKWSRQWYWTAHSLPWNFEDWPSSSSPLWVAAAANLRKIAEYLLDRGLASNDERISALCVASFGGHIQMVKLLVERGAINPRHQCSALRVASHQGHTQIVQFLLENGADVDERPVQDGYTALQGAIANRHTELVHLLVSKGAMVKAEVRSGTALYIASEMGQLDIVCLLLDNGANVNAAGGYYGSALQAAAEEGHMEIVRLLLKNGANFKSAAGKHGPALYLASREGHTEIVRLLLEKGAHVNGAGGGYGSALQAASNKGHRETIHLLLKHGANVKGEARSGPALYIVSEMGQEDIVRLLLDNGADVNAAGGNYGSALQAAANKGHIEIVRLLLKHSANVNSAAGKHGPALYLASWGGHTETVRLLLKKGADVNAAVRGYGSALLVAAYYGYVKIVHLLLEHGANVNSAARNYGPPLYLASREGHTEMVCLLLKKGVSVNAAGGEYGSALLVATYYGYMEIVRLLLEHGANVNSAAGKYGPALYLASEMHHTGIVRLLLEKGADVEAAGGQYGRALLVATYCGHMETVRLLLEHGANVNSASTKYGSALYIASERGTTRIVRLLLEKGAEVDTAGGEYGIALLVATYYGDMEIVRLLLEHGANVNSVAGSYGPALYLASKRGHTDIAHLLREKGGRI